MDNRELGKLGEQRAREFLKKLGYQIVTTNYYTRAGEIDIIAKDRESFVFVEVKTRTDTKHGYPEMNVHAKKLWHFKNAVQIYVLQNNIRNPFRLDVISVDLSGEKSEFMHFKNITV